MGTAALGTSCSSRFGAPDPATSQGREVLDLWRVLMFAGIGVGGLVLTLIAITVVRDGRRRSRPEGLPPQTRENIPLEIFYTAVPLVIVAVLFGLTLRAQRPVTRLVANPGLRVEVTGFQWGWRFGYPAQSVDVLGDSNAPPTLVLPVETTTRLRLASPDVIHSFFVPDFLTKRDVIPGSVYELDVTPTRVGHYGGYCAEFCGLDHARMTFSVDVVTQPDFERWLAEHQQRLEEDEPGDSDGNGDQVDPGAQALGPPVRVEGRP